MDHQGKVALVTGAAGNGMGRSIALSLSRDGAAVVVNYLRRRDEAEVVADCIRQRGGRALAVQGDVFASVDCDRLIGAALEAFGRVDICVIGPGAGWNPEKVINLKRDEAMQDMRQEITPVYNLLPPMLREMKKRKWGRIVGIASNLDIPSPSYAYNAAKSGRIDALKMAVGEAWAMGVTINVIAPGPVDGFTCLQDACAYCDHERAWQDRPKVSPQDIAEGVSFLCSDAAKYISGCVLPYRF